MFRRDQYAEVAEIKTPLLTLAIKAVCISTIGLGFNIYKAQNPGRPQLARFSSGQHAKSVASMKFADQERYQEVPVLSVNPYSLRPCFLLIFLDQDRYLTQIMATKKERKTFFF